MKSWLGITLLFVGVFALEAALAIIFNGVVDVVHPSVSLAFEIITHNLAAMLVIVLLAFVSVGLLGGLVVALNGMSFGSYLLAIPVTWAFVGLEVVSFCLAASIGTSLSIDCLAWLRGRRPRFTGNALAGVRLLCIACVGIVIAAVLETVIISTTGVGQ